MKKRLLSLFSVFFLLVSLFSVNINNIHAKENASIQPFATICTGCMKGTITITRKKIRSYSTGNQVNCLHGYRYGTDLVMRDVYEATHRCSNCGILFVDTEYGTSYQCHGYN